MLELIPPLALDKIRLGRAVLVAGQDINPGTTAEMVGNHHSMGALLGAASLPERQMLDDLRDRAPSGTVAEIAQYPWSLVLSSSVDTGLTRALEAAHPLARRVRRRFIDEKVAPALRMGGGALPVIHLSLEFDGQHFDGRIPTAANWLQINRIRTPAVLAELALAVGPAQIVVLAGLTSHDPLDLMSLAASLSDLDPEQIVCFSPGESATWLTSVIPGAIVINRSLADALRQQIVTKEAIPLPLLKADDVAVSVRAADTTDRTLVVFPAQELRDLRRYARILGDNFPQQTLNRELRNDAWRRFVRTPRIRCDYDSFHAEFCIDRDEYRTLQTKVNRRLARMFGDRAGKTHRGPIVLSGSPGCGRTTGLHWLGAKMRSDGWFVMYMEPCDAELDVTALEQVVRIVEDRLRESKAADAVLLLVDGLPRIALHRLDDRLQNAGRRVIVVGATIPYSPTLFEDYKPPSEETELPFKILHSTEIDQIERLLHSVGIDVARPNLVKLAREQGFLGILDRLTPDGIEGIQQVLSNELRRLLPFIAAALRREPGTHARGSLGDQLAAAFSAHDLAISDTVVLPTERDDTRPALELVKVILAVASLDKPTPLDLLCRRFPALLRNYEDFRRVGASAGFFEEVEIEDRLPALAPVNPAMVAIFGREFGGPNERIEELRKLADCCSWPSGEVSLGDLAPPERFVFELLRAVGPRGEYSKTYQRPALRIALLDILRSLREEHGLLLPQSLQLEAMLLRDLARNSEGEEREERLNTGLSLLESAKDAVENRARSTGRNTLLGSILVTYASTLRELMDTELAHASYSQSQKFASLALEAAKRSQLLQQTWHPFDVACTVYREVARECAAQDPQSPETRRRFQEAVSQMGMLLDIGPDVADLDQGQQRFRKEREWDLFSLTQALGIVEQEAHNAARTGDVAGLCLLARQRTAVRDGVTPPAIAKSAFDMLYQYREAATRDERARALMLRLWMAVALKGRSLEDWPLLISLEDNWWEALEDVTLPDVSLVDGQFHPLSAFWLATTLLRRSDIFQARPILRDLASTSGIGRVRALEPLVVLPDASGEPRRYPSVVRRVEAGRQVTAFVPELDLEVNVQQRHLASELIGVEPRDIVDVCVATNMRGVIGVGERWLAQRLKR